jgi:hypothetical protein
VVAGTVLRVSIQTRLRPGRASFSKARQTFSVTKNPEAKEAAVDLKALHAKIGELTLTNDFLSGALTKAGLLSVKR